MQSQSEMNFFAMQDSDLNLCLSITSKRKELEIWDWSQMKRLFKSYIRYIELHSFG